MDEFFVTFLFCFTVALIGVGIGLAWWWCDYVRDLKNLPSEDMKKDLIEELVECRKKGMSYIERLTFLKQKGIRKNVADILLADAERKKEV